MVFPIAGGNESKGYEISNSLRFNDDDSPLLTRAISTNPSDQKLTTISFWFKIGNITSAFRALYRFNDGSSTGAIYLRSGDDLQFAWNVSSGTLDVRPNGVFRDPSAWYHCHIKVDTTQGTAANRVIIHINGVERSYGTATYPNQNATLEHLSNGETYYIGGDGQSSDKYFDGYIAEFNVIDGQAKDYTDFGEFDDNGVWIPKKYTGTYGNNGFYLKFQQTGTSANSSGIGADTSGNDLHWTPSNLAALDVTEDTCTNNFCTLSPLAQNTYAGGTLSEGNCEWTSGVSEYSPRLGTFGLSSGKWYWEIKPTLNEGSSNDPFLIGISSTEATANSQELGHSSDDWAYYNNGKYRNSDSDSNYGNTYTVNDIIGVALDLDNSKLYFSKNGTFQNSGDPTSGYTGTGAISITSNLAATDFGFYFPALSDYDNSSGKYSRFQANFGNPPFAISSGNTDGKYGNFEYAPPSGYYALCTKRLAEFG